MLARALEKHKEKWGELGGFAGPYASRKRSALERVAVIPEVTAGEEGPEKEMGARELHATRGALAPWKKLGARFPTGSARAVEVGSPKRPLNWGMNLKVRGDES